MKHSPGPWEMKQECVDPEWHILTAGERIIANVHIETGNEADRANANLIVVAPELLEECERAYKHYLICEGVDGARAVRLAHLIETAKRK